KTEDGTWVKQAKEPGDQFVVPDGHEVKGVSALVGADGRTIQQWIKTREGTSAIDVAEALKAAFADYEPHAVAVPAPAATATSLLTLIPCNDWHIRMMAWERETGD